MKSEQIEFYRISNGAREGELPKRMKILNWGRNPAVGKFSPVVSDHTVAVLTANQLAGGADRVAIDFEHNTCKGTPAYRESTPEPRKVAGYGTPLAISGDGLYLTDIEWTPAGREYAMNYADLSPAIRPNAANDVEFLHSVALCRQGAVAGLSFYSAINPEGVNMEEDIKKMGEQFSAVQAVLDDLKTRLDALTNTAAPMEAMSAATAKIDSLEAKIVALSADLAADATRRDKAALLDGALRDGKVIALSAEAVGKLSTDDLKAHIAAVKSTVPLSAMTAAHIQQPISPSGDNLRRIAQAAGVNPDLIK